MPFAVYTASGRLVQDLPPAEQQRLRDALAAELWPIMLAVAGERLAEQGAQAAPAARQAVGGT